MGEKDELDRQLNVPSKNWPMNLNTGYGHHTQWAWQFREQIINRHPYCAAKASHFWQSLQWHKHCLPIVCIWKLPQTFSWNVNNWHHLKIGKTKTLPGTKQTINGHQESTFSKLQALRAFLKIIKVLKQLLAEIHTFLSYKIASFLSECISFPEIPSQDEDYSSLLKINAVKLSLLKSSYC